MKEEGNDQIKKRGNEMETKRRKARRRERKKNVQGKGRCRWTDQKRGEDRRKKNYGKGEEIEWRNRKQNRSKIGQKY